MKQIIDIGLENLILGFLLLILPILGFLYFKVKIIKESLIAILRMILQLTLVALYLEYIFAWNNALLNSLWVIIMILVGTLTTIKQAGLSYKYFIIPFFIAGFTSIFIVDLFFIGFVIRLDYFFDARYFIPITGMILGNALGHNIVGVSHYFTQLKKEQELYYFLLINTNNKKFTLRPFIQSAIKSGLNPLIATISVLGLISLPGMMTGQILGGSSPVVAIKYQILIMLAIFVGCSINLILSILLSNRFVFDGFGRLRGDLFQKP